MSQGLFITFDGPEGGGKTTQRELISKKLKELGHQVVDTREPGGTKLGKAIREWLLTPSDVKIASHAEILLFMADRAQHVYEVVKPALEAGKIVLCDRYVDSTIAYQVGGRGLPLELMEQLNKISHQGLMPHRTYLLMVDPNEGLKRAQKKGPDRFEEENLTFHEKVSAKYLQIAKENSKRIKLIEGNYSIEQTFEIIFNDLKTFLPKK